jgi:quinol monooxygenase YgiN
VVFVHLFLRDIMMRHVICALAVVPLAMLSMGCGGGGGGGGGSGTEMVVLLESVVAINKTTAGSYRDATRGIVESTRAEPGCLHFDFYEDHGDDSGMPRFWQYLVFQDEAAHQAHMARDTIKSWVALREGLIQPDKKSFNKMAMNVPNEKPVKCLKKESTFMKVVLVKLSGLDSQWDQLRKGSADLLKPTLAEPGCLYYDQLVPKDGKEKYVQEILWFVDEEAHKKHMDADYHQKFAKSFTPPLTPTKVDNITFFSALPPCNKSDVSVVV